MLAESVTEKRLRLECKRQERAHKQQNQRERDWLERIDYWANGTEGFRFGMPDPMRGPLYWVSVRADDGKTVTLAQPLKDTDIDFIRGRDWMISGDARPLTRDEVSLMIRIHAKSLDDLTIAEDDDQMPFSFVRDE